MAVSKKTNQHYVTRKYLSAFADSRNHVFVYDRIAKKIYKKNISEIAVEKDFYTIGNSSYQYNWDNIYTAIIEPKMGTLLDKIRAVSLSEIPQGTQIISKEDKQMFSLLLATQLTRGMKYRRTTEKTFASLLGLDHNKDFFSGSENAFLKEEFAKWVTSKSCNTQIMQPIHNRSWMFYYSQSNGFITSDEPLMVTNIRGDSFGIITNQLLSHETVMAYPISSQLNLLMLPPGIMDGNDRCLFEINDIGIVQRLNEGQLYNCNRQIYSKNGDTIRSISGCFSGEKSGDNQ